MCAIHAHDHLPLRGDRDPLPDGSSRLPRLALDGLVGPRSSVILALPTAVRRNFAKPRT